VQAVPLVVRKNALRLTTAEKQNFIAAVRQMKVRLSSYNLPGESLSAYNWLVRLHKDGFDNHLSGGSGVHMAPSFFPWHREFLRAFETELQLAAADLNITAPVAVPYWDWTDAACTAAVLHPDFMGGNGGGPGNQFSSGPAPRSSAYRALTGAFATANDQSSTFPVSVDPDISGFSMAAGRAEPPRFFLQRSFTSDPSFDGGYAGGAPPPAQPDQQMLNYLPTASQVATGMAMTVYDVAPWDNTVESPGVPYASRTTFRNYMEGHVGAVDAQGNPVGTMMHGRVHNWVGGNMSSPSSPNEPLFWMHHANLDRIWAEWQDLHGIRNFPTQWTYKETDASTPNVFITDYLYGFTTEDQYPRDVNSADTLDLRAAGIIYDTQNFLPVLTLEAVTPALATLRFPSIQGRQYTLVKALNLTDWSPAAAAVNGTGEAITLNVAVSPGVQRMYFRLHVAYQIP
jgi:tyrosinase